MKRFFTLLFSSLLLNTFNSFAQSAIDDVVASFKTGNISKLYPYFDNNVDISIGSKSSSYNKGQAEQLLKDFFVNNPVKSFQVMHKGEKAGSQFYIGTLETKTSRYRTTIFMKQKADKQVLQEIRLEN